MAVSRRAFVFTVIALVVVAAILILARTAQLQFPQSVSAARRASILDSTVYNLEEDLSRVAYIAGYRSLIGLEEHVVNTGEYLMDFDVAFLEMFVNGSVNGTYYSIMDDSTFTSFASRFTQRAQEQGINSQLTAIGVNARHDTPWSIKLEIIVDMQLSDRSGELAFNRTTNITAVVPITDIKDPLYSIGTLGRAPNTIQVSNISTPYITAANVTTSLQELQNTSAYIVSTDAPSFLQRFTYDLTPSPYGIQSLVPIAELAAQSLAIEQCHSVVDYLYFGNTSTSNYVIVNMDPNGFWLDDGNLARYNASGKTVGAAPCP